MDSSRTSKQQKVSRGAETFEPSDQPRPEVPPAATRATPTDAEWELALKITEHVLTMALQIVQEHREADTYPQAPGSFIPGGKL